MNVFFKRPLFTACFLYVFASVVALFCTPIIKTVVIICASVLILFTFVAWLLKRSGAYPTLCIILSSLMLIAAFLSSYAYFDRKAASYEKYYNDYHTVEATVISTKSKNVNWCIYEIQVDSIDGEKNSHKAILTCEYGSVLDPGFSFTARLFANSPDTSASTYNEKDTLFSDGIFIKYTSEEEGSVLITDEKAKHPRLFFASINAKMSKIFTLNLDKETAAMSSALFLGNKHMLDETVVRDFTRAGASHVLALSGMHMSIIMGALMIIFKWILGFNPKLTAVILSLCALAYLFITGCDVSAARSVIMLLLVYLSILLLESPDSITSLGVASALLMMIHPGTVLDAGYWMSVAATLGILVYMPAYNGFINRITRPIKDYRVALTPFLKIIGGAVASICALIPLVIVMCVFIKQLSLFTIITSAVLAIPSELCILFALLFLPFHKIPILSSFIGTVLRATTVFMTDFCAKISDIENIVISIDYPFTTLAAFIMGGALLFSLISKFKKPVLSLIPFAISILMFTGSILIYDHQEYDRIGVSYLNVSQAADMIVMSNKGEAIICDIGNGSTNSYYNAMAAVRKSRATEIRAIVLTKYTYSHNSSLLKMFKSNKVRELWLPHPLNKDEYSKIPNIKLWAEQYGVEIHMYDSGESLSIFDNSHINIYRQNIPRSTLPITLININTTKESLLYCSSAYDEFDFGESTNPITNAEYIIFGNVGPKTQKEFALPEKYDADLVVFADKNIAAHYDFDITHNITYALAESRCKFVLDE